MNKTKLLEELVSAAIDTLEKLLDLLQQMLEVIRTPNNE